MMCSHGDDYSQHSQDAISVAESPLNFPANKGKHGRSACAICGAKSAGINFDVLTCSSCKAFFRRNGIKPLHQFVCRSSGSCKIDERSRRQCTACRLRKCFATGMIKERIRTEEQNQRHRVLVEENRQQKLKKYQQQQHKDSRVKLEEGVSSQVCSTSSSSSCSYSSQVDLIFEIFIESTRETITSDFHFQFDHDLTAVLNRYCLPISCFIMFLKQLSQFQRLPVDDRLIILKNNTKVLLPLLTHLLNTTCDVPLLVNQPGPRNINQKISYAYSLFANIVPNDNKLLALLMAGFLFCPCLFTSKSLCDAGHITDHSRQLIQYAYDEYTQLVWCYIIEKYEEDEHQATLIYMKIVTTLLRLQNVTSEIYDIMQCSVQIDQLHMMMQSVLHLT